MDLRTRTLSLLMLAAIVVTGLSAADSTTYVWWEGEAPTSKSADLNTEHWFDAKDPNLSGALSLGVNDYSISTFAEYTIQVPVDGEYALYVRKFWKHGPFKFRFDQNEWIELENETLIETTKLAQHSISWLPAGKHRLDAGQHTFRLEGVPKSNGKFGAFAIDCFLLVRVPFLPSGTLKPGEKLGLADAGRWAFEPDVDTFERADAVGLAGLNEDVAGEHGWIRMTKDGAFERGDGQPIRFWCVNTGVHRTDDLDYVRMHAKHIAKRGVNMWRHHGHFNPGKDQDPFSTVNEADIRALQRGVAVFKQEGIYSTFSPYWATHTIEVGQGWGIDGVEGRPVGTVFWEPRLQEAYKYWLKEALTRPNPFDPKGTPLKDDPACAIFQIQNEDSLLFWTAQRIKGREKERLTEIYHQWRADNGLPGTPPLKIELWRVAEDDQQVKDTCRFFAETMQRWNAEVARYLRDEIGFKGLINAGNWKTASNDRLLDLERYSYTANEVIGSNNYVNGAAGGGAHVNPKEGHKAGYQINVGDFFQDSSTLLEPSRLATNARQVAHHAYIIPESTWVAPFSYQSEGPLLVAAYSSLHGIDGYYWFALGKTGYDPTIQKWQAANPALMGGWPAASLIFRRGYLKQGEPAVVEHRKLASMWNLEPAQIVESAGFDINRDGAEYNAGGTGNIDPMAYLVGPVQVHYDSAGNTQVAELAKYIDRSAKIVTSNTGEIRMDYGSGICLIDAPKAQGATGFLGKRGTIELGDVTITSSDDYVTVLVVSIDDQPLQSSKQVLLQITTRCRPYGWKDADSQYKVKDQQFTGKRIENLGSAPWNVWKTENLRVTLRGRGVTKATVLDANLYPTDRPITTEAKGGALTVMVPEDAMYILLSAR